MNGFTGCGKIPELVIPKGGVGPRDLLFLRFGGKADLSLRSG
jgi:hypothetical protein